MSFTLCDVVIRRDLDPSLLSWITAARASCEDGLNVNHEYADLRGMTLDDLTAAIAWERSGWNLLAANDYRYPVLIEYTDGDEELWDDGFGFPQVEFGMVSMVCALSALGCVPITSCRGPSLADGFPHQQPCPSVSFYMRRSQVKLILGISERSQIGLVNGDEGMAELYTDDLRKMLETADSVRTYLLASNPSNLKSR